MYLNEVQGQEVLRRYGEGLRALVCQLVRTGGAGTWGAMARASMLILLLPWAACWCDVSHEFDTVMSYRRLP